MPSSIKKARAARKSRKGANGRKDRSQHGRQGSDRTKESGPRVIANSVFALTLNTKLGIEVESKLEGGSAFDDKDDYEKMFDDLFAAYIHCMKLAGTPTHCNPRKEGLEINACLAFVVNGFKNNLLPNGWAMRIDRDGDEYYFTAFVDCSFPDWWHAIEIMPVIEDLRRNAPHLLELFLEFIAYLYKRLDMPTWWNGGMGYCEYMVDEQIECWEDNMGEIEAGPDASKQAIEDAKLSKLRYEDTLDAFNSYNAGEIKEYEKLLTDLHPDKKKLASRINKSRSRHAIVSFMKEAMAFLEEPCFLSDYILHELHEENGGEQGLEFDRQVTLIWDWNDAYAAMEMDAIDVDVQNFGVMPPLLYRYYTNRTKEIPKDFTTLQTWPSRFSKLWGKYRDMVEVIRKRLKINYAKD
jgi:hypothetical protein